MGKKNKKMPAETESGRNSKPKTKKKKNPNREIMRITYLFLVIFVGMIGYYIKFHIKDSDDIINNTYNKRQAILEQEIIRGNILSDDGQILATTISDEEGNDYRNYPFGNLFAHSVGFSTHGTTGIELMANYKLLTSNVSIIQTALNDFKGVKNPGNNVLTSLNVDMTKAAYDALGEHQGAVIVLEPSTGKILTMVSKPDFNPNEIDSIWEDLVSGEGNSNLVNRTTSGLYTPGSTFKLFTLLEYIHENPDFNAYSYDCSSRITIDGNTIHCAGHSWHGGENLMESFANSCNSSFVNLGLTLDKGKFKNLCNSLLFNSELPLSYSYNKSSFVLNESSSGFDTMQTVIGQGETLITPIHLAMIAAAIQNNGILMKPYVITEIQSSEGKKLEEYKPEEYKRLFSVEDSAMLKDFMGAVVTNGTGTKLKTDAYNAYGKTGTAQINDGSQTNSLFMGFAEKDGKAVAICVGMEDMPEGSTFAVPAAKKVLDVYFNVF